MKRRIGAEWASYLAGVVPADAGETQVEETRRAFYAGAASLFGFLMRQLDPGTEPTEGDIRALSEINAEFKEYLAALSAKTKSGGL